MYLIVGFGNPGTEYLWTRHNFGFLALDFYFKKKNYTWEPHKKFNATWSKQGNTIFVKPETYYNNVGESIRAFMDFYKIPRSNLLVLCDDFDLPFGTLRERTKGSSGGNNGLKSTISHLSSEEFARLRLGTGNGELRQKLGDIDFVLGRFTEEEKSLLPDILNQVETRIDQFSE